MLLWDWAGGELEGAPFLLGVPYTLPVDFYFVPSWLCYP